MDPEPEPPLRFIQRSPNCTGFEPSLRAFATPQLFGSDQLSEDPPQPLAEDAQRDHYPPHQSWVGHPNHVVRQPKDEPGSSDGGTGSSGDFDHDSILCLKNYVTKLLDWYQSGVVAGDDIKSLTRQVDQFIHATCKYYAEQGMVPTIRDVDMVSPTIQFPDHMSTYGAVREYPPTTLSETYTTPVIGDNDISVRGCGTTELVVEDATDNILGWGSVSSLPYGGLPSGYFERAQTQLEADPLTLHDTWAPQTSGYYESR